MVAVLGTVVGREVPLNGLVNHFDLVHALRVADLFVHHHHDLLRHQNLRLLDWSLLPGLVMIGKTAAVVLGVRGLLPKIVSAVEARSLELLLGRLLLNGRGWVVKLLHLYVSAC